MAFVLLALPDLSSQKGFLESIFCIPCCKILHCLHCSMIHLKTQSIVISIPITCHVGLPYNVTQAVNTFNLGRSMQMEVEGVCLATYYLRLAFCHIWQFLVWKWWVYLVDWGKSYENLPLPLWRCTKALSPPYLDLLSLQLGGGALIHYEKSSEEPVIWCCFHIHLGLGTDRLLFSLFLSGKLPHFLLDRLWRITFCN